MCAIGLQNFIISLHCALILMRYEEYFFNICMTMHINVLVNFHEVTTRMNINGMDINEVTAILMRSWKQIRSHDYLMTLSLFMTSLIFLWYSYYFYKNVEYYCTCVYKYINEITGIFIKLWILMTWVLIRLQLC